MLICFDSFSKEFDVKLSGSEGWINERSKVKTNSPTGVILAAQQV